MAGLPALHVQRLARVLHGDLTVLGHVPTGRPLMVLSHEPGPAVGVATGLSRTRSQGAPGELLGHRGPHPSRLTARARSPVDEGTSVHLVGVGLPGCPSLSHRGSSPGSPDAAGPEAQGVPTAKGGFPLASKRSGGHMLVSLKRQPHGTVGRMRRG